MVLKNLLSSTAITLSALALVSCGGSSGGSTVPPPPPPPPPPTGDTVAPVVSFSPATLTVNSEATGASTLTATDNTAVTTGPTVTCTNGGSFASGTFTAPRTGLNITSICTAVAGDAAGNNGSGTLTVTVNQAPASGDVALNGKLTFDLVPLNTSTNGLNYGATTQAPARGITMEVLSATGAILRTAVTDAAGNYSFTLSPNTNVRVRAKAEMLQTTGAQWNVRVVDNTSSNALYTIIGSLTDIGTLDQTRNLTAGSGWGGSSYTGTRAAGPFAILNPIYTALKKIEAVDPDVVFPPAEFNWSVNNRAANGVVANGEIGTSSYVGNGEILVLGDDNADTDEYDDHVIVHEWGHYFEDQLSRSDSVGGPHSGGEELDPRVAMGEGFGNALSGIITDDPFYRDSSGNQQGNGFAINVETNDSSGWYDESSVQSIIYDIYDSNDDGSDTLSLGLAPIYQTLTGTCYIGQDSFTTIFSFINEMRSIEPSNADAIMNFASTRGMAINNNNFGGNENNGGSVQTALPVYKNVGIHPLGREIVSTNSQGLYNKLGNRVFIRRSIQGNEVLTFTMRRLSGATNRDPDFIVYKNGVVVGRAESGPAESESLTLNVTVGTYVIDAYDFFNFGQSSTGVPGEATYNFSITR